MLIGCSGCLAATNFATLCRSFCEFAEVKAVATKASLHFIDLDSLPPDISFFNDQNDNVFGIEIELIHWADILLVAQLSANTLAKIIGGFRDSLLTRIVLSWHWFRPFFIAPSMSYLMWDSPLTQDHVEMLEYLGVNLIQPGFEMMPSGTFEPGPMADILLICAATRSTLYSIYGGWYPSRADLLTGLISLKRLGKPGSPKKTI